MLDEKKPQREKEQPAHHGYYAHPVGEEGVILYLSEREREQAEHQRRKPRWYDHVGQRIWRWWLAFCQWLRRYAVIGAMLATVVYAKYAVLQWGTMQGQFTTMQGQLTEMKEANKTASEARDKMQGQLDAMQASNAQNERTFQATQRAAVTLGLPDGKFIDFTVRGKKLRVALYFRNYGIRTARSTIITVVPVITSAQAPSGVLNFSPVAPRPSNPAAVGPDIPPGFQHTEYLTSSVNSRKTFDIGKISVKLVGRITYQDEFGFHCETFSAAYDHDLRSFRLRAGYLLCDGKPHTIFFCDAKNVLWEAEQVSGSVGFECTQEGLRVRTGPGQKNNQ